MVLPFPTLSCPTLFGEFIFIRSSLTLWKKGLIIYIPKVITYYSFEDNWHLNPLSRLVYDLYKSEITRNKCIWRAFQSVEINRLSLKMIPREYAPKDIFTGGCYYYKKQYQNWGNLKYLGAYYKIVMESGENFPIR